MAEETENQEQQPEEASSEQAPEEAPQEPTAEEAATPAAEEPAAEEPAAEEPTADAPAEEAPAPEAPPAEEAAEVLSPKQRRKRARAEAKAPAQPERAPEERAAERGEVRRRKAGERSRWRAKQKSKGRERAGTVPRSSQDDAAGGRAEPGKRKVRQGVVVSDKGDKTITVRIDAVHRHRVYGKVIRESTTLHAHDESNEANTGDLVRVVESRPLSRTKRWRLIDVLERAK
jgi:small subunit ribosomal protein S17